MLTVILTGGSSRRMGCDKALLPSGADGVGMRDELVRRYAAALGQVAVSVDRAGRYQGSGAIELPDAFPGRGPMNGLCSAFRLTDAGSVFLTATDIINGDPALARYLADALGNHDACVIRRRSGHLEPLFAVYARSCMAVAEACLRDGQHSMRNLINAVDTLFIDEGAICGRWDLDAVLMNINTPEEYEKFRAH